MWALVENNSVTRVYTRPTAITVGDVQYPANIMSMWTASELEAIGIYEVVQDNTNLKDSRYYYNGAESFNFADGVVTRSYGVATAKELADTLWTQEDIDSMDTAPEDVSVGDLRARGLTFIHKQRINNQANSILSETDWYRIRAEDGGAAMPANILTFRATIRTESNTMCDLIDAAASVDALAALYVYNSDDPSTRPLGEFPLL